VLPVAFGNKLYWFESLTVGVFLYVAQTVECVLAVAFGTHNTHNRQTSMPPVGFEPTISAGEGPSVHLRPNFQGLPWFEFDGLVKGELLIRFLLN